LALTRGKIRKAQDICGGKEEKIPDSWLLRNVYIGIVGGGYGRSRCIKERNGRSNRKLVVKSREGRESGFNDFVDPESGYENAGKMY
jgi:hypothetical protein